MKLGKVPILDTINKVPGGLMVIPLVLGVVVNSLLPEFLQIGSFTTALFKQGANVLIATLFFCSGAQILFKSAGQALYKGVVLNVSKVFFGVSLGVILAKIGGPGAVVLGIGSLGLIGCMSNSNGGLYTALATKYGDKTDVGAIAILSSNDELFYEMLFMGLTGVATIPIKTLFACIFPIIVGMILGNLDDKMRDFLKPGILLGVLTVVWTGLASCFVYKLLVKRKNRRSCAVGAAVGTSAGNSVAIPAAIAAVDAAWEPYAATATAQCSASVIVTAVLTPFVVNWLYKYEERHGLIRSDKL